MSKQEITAEELSKVLLYTASALPDNPSERGMKPREIKAFFYKYISVLVDIINEKLGEVEGSRISGLKDHNLSESSHIDIRATLDDLATMDITLGNAIAGSLKEHNADKDSHPILLAELKRIDDAVQIAHNLASGKSKIYPVNDIYEMLDNVNDRLNVGDKFVLAQESVPDFILFEKDSAGEGAISLSQTDLLLGLELVPGKSYICSNGFLFVATESGIDTSLFAKQTEVESIIAELLTKETKKALKEETAETVTLTSDTEYNLGLRTSVVLALPEEIPNEFEVIVNFRSGAVATAFDAPNSIVFTQDDCYLGRLTPITNRIYEINIKNVGGVLIGKVGCCDYEVIE